MDKVLLDVDSLSVNFKTENGLLTAVKDISLSIKPSETICLVGESGSGKSVTSKAIMRLIEYENGYIANGSVRLADDHLSHLSLTELNKIRGKKIAMVFQEPMTAFDPLFTIGSQLTQAMMNHLKLPKKAAWQRGIDLLNKVGLSEAELRMEQYPSELSGGMLQRAMIAMAISCEPDLLIADEPTTALDVTIQLQIIQLLKELQNELNMAILLITHNLGVASQLADRIVVMYAGTIVEEGTLEQLLTEPHHPYTKGLIKSTPKIDGDKDLSLYSIDGNIPALSKLPSGCRFHPRCSFATDVCRKKQPIFKNIKGHKSACWHTEKLIEHLNLIENDNQETSISTDRQNTEVNREHKEPLFEITLLSKSYPIKRSKKVIKAVNNVSFTLYKGETFGLVGESGSGKSTLGRILLRLENPTNGEVLFKGESLTQLKESQLRKKRRDMQVVFQDPYGSMNPRWKVFDIIAEPLKTHEKGLSKKMLVQKVSQLLEKVGLNKDALERYPHEFSGGQRQRIAIARAIALSPSFILADEAVSALDVSVQAQIINLLKDLQRSLELTYLFIGHDLSVVRHISDRIGVMYLGEIVEIATSEQLFQRPLHPYTKTLIQSIPSFGNKRLNKTPVLEGEIPSPLNPPSGCSFRTRCPLATKLCQEQAPELIKIEKNRFISCHYVR